MRALAVSALLLLGLSAWGAGDVSTAPLDPLLPKAETKLSMLKAKEGKPTAGDIIILRVTRPSESATAEPAMAEKLKSEPVEWGQGRILWWKNIDEAKLGGDVLIGLTSYTPGAFEIAAIPFVKDGKPVFATMPQTVEYSAIGGDKQQDDIYPPLSTSLPKWIWVLLGLLALAIVLGGIWWLARWQQRKKAKIEELARAPKILTPIEEFEKARAATEQRALLASQKFKPHYFALSEAAKKFLGRAFRFDAEERTTRELVRELEGLGMADELIDGWETIFDEMDITKFTDQIPELTNAQTLASRLSELVAKSYAESPHGREAAAAARAAALKQQGASR